MNQRPDESFELQPVLRLMLPDVASLHKWFPWREA